MSVSSASNPSRTARTSLAISLLGWAVALVVAGFCAASGAMLYDMRRDTWDRAVTAENNLLHTLSQDIARNIEMYDLSLQAVVDGVAEPDLATLNPRLQNMLLYDRAASAKDLGAILVLDRDGRVVRGSKPEAIGADLADREYFRAQKADPNRGLFISEPFTRRVTGSDEVVALSRRLRSPDGSFAGIVVGTVRLSYFRDLFAKADIGPHGAISLIQLDGTCLVRVPYTSAQVGTSFAGSPNLQRYLATGETLFTGTAVSDGVKRIYDIGRIGDLPLLLTVALSEEDVFASWHGKAGTAGIALAVLCLTAGVLWRILVGQMRRTAEAKRMLARSEAQYRLLADHAQDVIMRLDRTLRRTYVSPAVAAVLGYTPESLIGLSPKGIIHPDDWPVVSALILEAQQTGTDTEATYRLRHAAGHYAWVEGRYSVVPEDRGFIVVLRDITKRKADEQRLAALNAELVHLASNDALTGLANRRRFDEVMDEECRRAARQGTPVSLLFIDVDRFKSYNDLYGHQDGDACLRAIAEAVRSVARRPGTLTARYGGEELAVVLPGTDEDGAAAVAERVRAAIEALGRPHAGNRSCGGVVTASLGCATTRPEGGCAVAPAALIAVADARLYEAKRTGRNRVVGDAPVSLSFDGGADEERRLAVLATYAAAGADGPSGELDGIARMAALLFDAPVAFVSFVGRDEVTVAGRHGTGSDTIPRENAYCTLTVQGEDPLVLPDTRADARFPFESGLGFYAGAPLVSPIEGRRLGALCIADTAPRKPLDDRQRELLAGLARLAMDDIERRRLKAERRQDRPSAAA